MKSVTKLEQYNDGQLSQEDHRLLNRTIFSRVIWSEKIFICKNLLQIFFPKNFLLMVISRQIVSFWTDPFWFWWKLSSWQAEDLCKNLKLTTSYPNWFWLCNFPNLDKISVFGRQCSYIRAFVYWSQTKKSFMGLKIFCLRLLLM